MTNRKADKATAKIDTTEAQISETIRVKVARLTHARGLGLPTYHSEGAAGLDLVAAVKAKESVILRVGGRALIPTGLVLELPPGYEAQVRPRSGLAYNHGVTVLNAPGTIDWDYRGEVNVLLVNHGEQAFEITRGERIAQLVIQRVIRAELVPGAKLTTTKRGTGGFGSTGRRTRTPRKRR